ncbi:MAG: GNAT family N-acetyltransferase [Acidimicrobiales bacterium]
MTGVPIVFRPADPTTAPASEFLEAMVGEIDTMYGRHAADPTRVVDTATLVSPVGIYLVGWVGEEPVAGGGVRPLFDDTCEIKRMYVTPAHRRRGHAAALLAALEREAVALGYRTARLDTGPKQPWAKHLYRSTGYMEIARYNQNWHADFWGEKVLRAPDS